MPRVIRTHDDQSGFSAAAGLVAMAVGLVLVALLLLMSMNALGGGSGGASNPKHPSILSPSSAETQIKLCAEGRDSTYGDPPSPAQQATCVRQLLGEVAGAGPAVSGSP